MGATYYQQAIGVINEVKKSVTGKDVSGRRLQPFWQGDIS